MRTLLLALLLLVGSACFGLASGPIVPLADFETRQALNSFITWTFNVSAEQRSDWSAQGDGAALIRFLTDAAHEQESYCFSEWAKGGFSNGNWASSERLAFEVKNPQDDPVTLRLIILDEVDHRFERRFELTGWQTASLEAPIADLAAAGLNTRRIRQLRLAVPPETMRTNPTDLYLDWVRLEGGDPLAIAAATSSDAKLVRPEYQRVVYTDRKESVPKLDTTKTRRLEPTGEIPVAYEADVVVVGGGTAGCIAAIAAARAGASTLLIERSGALGGTATNGLVPFAHIPRFDGGLVQEFLDRRLALGGAAQAENPEIERIALTQMVLESGVKLLLNTLCVDAVMGADRLRGVVIASKSGTQAVLGTVIIDATGDGDVAAFAGAPWQFGRDRDNRTQAMTLCFLLGNVDTRRAPRYGPLVQEAISKAKAAGELDTEWAWDANLDPRVQGEHGVVSVNCMNVPGASGINAADLTYAYLEALRETELLVKVFRKYLPGCEECYLVETAPQLGVRETRRIMGEYVLDARDVLNGARFEDSVARGWYPIDVHEPDRTGVLSGLKPPIPYDIPYRCLVPKAVEGLLVTGRCISVDNLALGSTRIQSTSMALGQAAGLAAALCVEKHLLPRQLDGKLVHAALVKAGCNLGETPDPRDVALIAHGASAKASSSLSGYNPNAVIDGLSTPGWTGRWVSDRVEGPHWVEVNLGQPRQLETIRITFFQDPGSLDTGYIAKAFKLEYETGGHWVTLAEETENTDLAREWPAPAEPITRLRLTITDPGRDDIARVMELEALTPK